MIYKSFDLNRPQDWIYALYPGLEKANAPCESD